MLQSLVEWNSNVSTGRAQAVKYNWTHLDLRSVDDDHAVTVRSDPDWNHWICTSLCVNLCFQQISTSEIHTVHRCYCVAPTCNRFFVTLGQA
jgi:hypothetical protein